MIAFRSWGRLLLTAFGVGLLAGAGQLGIAYGLGIVRFARSFGGAAINQWPAQLTWVSWFAMVAAVAGAVIAERLARRREMAVNTASRIAMAVAAGLGAAVVAPLSMQPARTAQAVGSTSPMLAAGMTAIGGAVVGVLAALAALSQRPLGWNIAAVTGAAWLLALVSVLPSLGPDDPLPAVRLGVLDPSSSGAANAQRLTVIVLPVLALIAGAATGAFARWRKQPVLAVAACGVLGPGTLAVAYLMAGTGNSADSYQAAPYWSGLLAVGAGALGSVAAAVVRKPAPKPAADATAALEPTEILNPIRNGDTTPRPSGQQADAGPAGEPRTPEPGSATVPVPDPATVPTAVPVPDPAAEPDSAATTGFQAQVIRTTDIPTQRRSRSAPDEPADTGPVPPAPGSDPPLVDRTKAADLPATGRFGSAPAVGLSTDPARNPPTTDGLWPSAVGPDRTSEDRTDDSWDAFAAARRPQLDDQESSRAEQAGRSRADQAGRSRAEQPGADPSDRPGAGSPDPGPAPSGQDGAEDPAAATETTSGAARPRRGRFRRNQPTGEPVATPADREPDSSPSVETDEPSEPRGRGRVNRAVPTGDEEYVDWVSGLSEQAGKDAPQADDRPRRTLRSSGRHHLD